MAWLGPRTVNVELSRGIKAWIAKPERAAGARRCPVNQARVRAGPLADPRDTLESEIERRQGFGSPSPWRRMLERSRRRAHLSARLAESSHPHPSEKRRMLSLTRR